MNARIISIMVLLASLGFLFFGANQSPELNDYQTAIFLVNIIAITIGALALAVSSLRSNSLLFLVRSTPLASLPVLFLNWDGELFSIAAIISSFVLLSFYSEKLISLISQDVGIANEDTFTLKSPSSVTTWFSFAWLVFWLSFIESIHLFISDKTILGLVLFVFTIGVLAVFLSSQMRILLRRCIIVPYGIVLSDHVSLTDVVLFPLAKIKDVGVVNEVPQHQEFAFTTHRKKGDAVLIELTEATDSLIIRNNVNETTRKSVTHIYVSIERPSTFVKAFKSRFHKAEPKPISEAEEKMIEKKLGIETAPRSNAKLPKHRP